MFVKEIYLSNEARSTIRNRINRINRGKGGQNQFICVLVMFLNRVDFWHP